MRLIIAVIFVALDSMAGENARKRCDAALGRMDVHALGAFHGDPDRKAGGHALSAQKAGEKVLEDYQTRSLDDCEANFCELAVDEVLKYKNAEGLLKHARWDIYRILHGLHNYVLFKRGKPIVPPSNKDPEKEKNVSEDQFRRDCGTVYDMFYNKVEGTSNHSGDQRSLSV